jgi:CRP-like cAMP-binding protein/Fe-S-cluster-containing hydrogenase component 2
VAEPIAETSPSEVESRQAWRLKASLPIEPEKLVELPLFAGVPAKARLKVVESARKYLQIVQLEPGDLVLRQGEYSDSAYYVMEGAVEVLLVRAPASEPAAQARLRGGAHVPPRGPRAGARPGTEGMLGRGDSSDTLILGVTPAELAGPRKFLETGEVFGELSALSRYPVSANVRVIAPTRLLQIRLRGLRTLMQVSKEFKKFLETRYRERSLAHLLQSVPLLAEVGEAMIGELRDQAEVLSFGPGQVIVEEGAPADGFLLVRGGYVKVATQAASASLAVTYLRTGDHAGEAALLFDEAWPFTLQALEHVELVKISRELFQTLLKRHPQIEEGLWKVAVQRLKDRGAAVRNPIASEHMQMAMDTGLIHGESVLLIDLSTCTRCDECVRGCASAHGGEPRFIREGQKYRNWLIPTACYQCSDPVCMMECPTGAITREINSLEVTINGPDHPTRPCIGCHNCADRCPWGNIIMVETGKARSDGKPEEKATKCDLCLERPQGPACVQMCPHGSAVRISFKDLERVTGTLR